MTWQPAPNGATAAALPQLGIDTSSTPPQLEPGAPPTPDHPAETHPISESLLDKIGQPPEQVAFREPPTGPTADRITMHALGRLKDPSDAAFMLSPAEFENASDEDIKKAISDLLDSKPHLAIDPSKVVQSVDPVEDDVMRNLGFTVVDKAALTPKKPTTGGAGARLQGPQPSGYQNPILRELEKQNVLPPDPFWFSN